jgi:hypothetical protein
MDGVVKVAPRNSATPTRSAVKIVDDKIQKTPERAATNFLSDVSSKLDNIFTTPTRSPQRDNNVQPHVQQHVQSHVQPQRTGNVPSHAHVQSHVHPQVQPQPNHLNTPMRTMGREYTKEEIDNLLTDDYFNVPSKYWKSIPIGAHIRVFKRAAVCGSDSRGARFRPGGFVKSHMMRGEEHIIVLETILHGKEERGNIVFPMSTLDLDEIWKKTDRNAYIEITLMSETIRKYESENKNLKNRVDKMEKILKVVVEKMLTQ